MYIQFIIHSSRGKYKSRRLLIRYSKALLAPGGLTLWVRADFPSISADLWIERPGTSGNILEHLGSIQPAFQSEKSSQ